MADRALMEARRRPVPIVLQTSAVDCGAACLTMILRALGDDIALAACREQVGSAHDGVTALMLAQAARAFGLEVTAYKVAPEDGAHIALPAIAHWRRSHFVVIERWDARSATVIDPATGRQRLTAAEFADEFSGVVLTFAPGPAFVGRPCDRRSARPTPRWRSWFARLLRTPGTRHMLAQLILASVQLQVLGLALPLFTQIVVDQMLPVGRTGATALLGLGMLLFACARGVAG
jgi:ATP-binding cassette, subfamily B, bacterial